MPKKVLGAKTPRHNLTEDRISTYLKTLSEIKKECKDPDWDEDNAVGIKEKAILNAIAFVKVFPKMFPEPSIFPMPNGNVGFQWNASGNALFISMSEKKSIHYAYSNGDIKSRGVVLFSTEFPQRFRELLTNAETK